MFSNHIEHHLNVHCRRICALSPVEQSSNNDDPDSSMTRRSSSLRDDDDDADSYGSDDDHDRGTTGGGTGGNKKKLLQMIVGTCYPSNQHLEEHLPNLGENLIIKTLYDDEVHELYESTIYNHTSGEIWSMTTPSPTTSSTSGRSSNLVGTVGSPSSESIQVSLWKMPSVDDDDVHFEDDDGVPRTDLQLQHVLAVDDGDSPNKSQIVWSPHSLSDIVATTNTCSLQTFDVETGEEMFHASLQTFFGSTNSSNPLQLIPTVWDPLSEHQIALAVQNNLHIWDVRASSKSPSSMYRNLHSHSILSLDANPNQPHVYATGGQEGQFKIWDLRYGIVPQVTSKEEHLWDLPQVPPLVEEGNTHVKQQWLYSKKCCGGLGAHTHWISSLKYNPYHDQLLLSSGTDTFVNLWRLSSVSSAPILETEDDMMNEGEVNVPFSSINPDYDFDTTTTSSPYNKEESKTTTGYRKGSTNYGTKRTMEEFQKPFDKWGTLDDFDQHSSSSNTKENKQRQNQHDRDGNDESIISTKTTTKKTNPHLSDKLVTQFECQEAVYDMTWLDAWTYASVTWDGQLVVNSVPSQEKYKILL